MQAYLCSGVLAPDSGDRDDAGASRAPWFGRRSRFGADHRSDAGGRVSDEGILFIVGTPIGNLDDLTARAVETLGAVDACYAEDTRRTGRLLSRLGISVPLRSLHEHNERQRVSEILARLADGERLAIASDAGTPTLSDPGRKVVAEAWAAGHRVVPIPGPSAVPAALSGAGLPADRFWFAGFPPRRGGERRGWLERVRRMPDTIVVFEAPGRLAALLADLARIGLDERPAAVCRELTKLHETIRRGTIAELATVYEGETVKGEVTLVVAGAGEDAPDRDRDADPERVRATVAELAQQGLSRREIAARLEERFDVTRNEAYQWSLEVGRADG